MFDLVLRTCVSKACVISPSVFLPNFSWSPTAADFRETLQYGARKTLLLTQLFRFNFNTKFQLVLVPSYKR